MTAHTKLSLYNNIHTLPFCTRRRIFWFVSVP